MKVKVSELKELMSKALNKRGYSSDEIPFLVETYLGGELRGHTSHGLAGFSKFASQKKTELEKPEVISQTPAFTLIDAKSNHGSIIGRDIADRAIEQAKQNISHTVMIKNMDSWLRPGEIAEYVAERDFVAIVINSGGGFAIAPPGGYDPVVGTNPIAYGIPTENEPIVVDMATSKMAWGQVRLANKFGTKLPDDTFIDSNGDVTRDPKKAEAVKPFGGHKGFAMALLVEIMCGSLLGMDMMIDSSSGNTFAGKIRERGALIYVIDPTQINDLDEFKKANSKLISDIEAGNHKPDEKIRIPGVKAGRSKAKKLAEDSIEIEDEIWKEISGL